MRDEHRQSRIDFECSLVWLFTELTENEFTSIFFSRIFPSGFEAREYLVQRCRIDQDRWFWSGSRTSFQAALHWLVSLSWQDTDSIMSAVRSVSRLDGIVLLRCYFVRLRTPLPSTCGQVRSPRLELRLDRFVPLVGCIAAELYTLRPLFPGSSEIDQMFKICAVMGTPTRVNPTRLTICSVGISFASKDDWPEGHMLAAKLSFRWPQCVRAELKKIMPSANSDAIDLVGATLYWDPKRRPNAPQVRQSSLSRRWSNIHFLSRVWNIRTSKSVKTPWLHPTGMPRRGTMMWSWNPLVLGIQNRSSPKTGKPRE